MQPKSRLFLISLLLLSAVTSAIPIPSAFAVDPVIRNTANKECSNVTSCTTGTMTVFASGDLIILGVGIISGGASCPPVISSASDSMGSSYSIAAQSCNSLGSVYKREGLVYATTSSSGAGKTFTVTLASPSGSFFDIFVYDVSGVGASNALVDTEVGSGLNCVPTCDFSMTAPQTYANAPSVYIAMLGYESACATPTAATGFTLDAGGFGYAKAEYGTTASSVPSPTSYTTSIHWIGGCAASNSWNIVAGAWGVAPSPVQIAACTFFQLQCWWYPFLFMVVYSGFLVLVGVSRRVTPNGLTHLFITGLTFGSLIAVILGIMNVVFPLLLLAVNTLYVLRFKR